MTRALGSTPVARSPTSSGGGCGWNSCQRIGEIPPQARKAVSNSIIATGVGFGDFDLRALCHSGPLVMTILSPRVAIPETYP
jgi:hypothetical protein